MAAADEPGLDQAYAVETPDDNRRLYAGWAATYDSDFIEANGYVYHRNIAALFAAGLPDGGPPAEGAVLDVGCGTGIVGEELRRLGVPVVDGVDISPEMLAIAEGRRLDGVPIYRELLEVDLTGLVPMATDTYGGVVSVGTFTHGHLGPEPLDELVRIAQPNARFVIGINAKHWDAGGFGAWFERAEADERITSVALETVRIYDAMEGPHAHDMATAATFRKR